MEIENENCLAELQERVQKLKLKNIRNKKQQEIEQQALHRDTEEIRSDAETMLHLNESFKGGRCLKAR